MRLHYQSKNSSENLIGSVYYEEPNRKLNLYKNHAPNIRTFSTLSATDSIAMELRTGKLNINKEELIIEEKKLHLYVMLSNINSTVTGSSGLKIAGTAFKSGWQPGL